MKSTILMLSRWLQPGVAGYPWKGWFTIVVDMFHRFKWGASPTPTNGMIITRSFLRAKIQNNPLVIQNSSEITVFNRKIIHKLVIVLQLCFA